MKKPLFEIGEEVLLRSKTYPEYNGEYRVQDIIDPFGLYIDRFDAYEKQSTGNVYAYRFTAKHFSNEMNAEIIWAESALHKKHKPSELSFQELVSSLKTPINA